MIHSTRHSASSRCVAPVRYMVTGRVACIYLPRHGHKNGIADTLPRLTYCRRPAFYRLSPRSNDLEVIRSPSNVRSNSSEQRHVNIVAALTVGLSARQPKERRQLVHQHREHTARTSKPNSDWRDSHSRAVKRSRDAYFWGCMWNFRLGSDPTLIGLRAVARSTRWPKTSCASSSSKT